MFQSRRLTAAQKTDINVVETCQQYFSFRLPSDILQKRTMKFLRKRN